MAPQPISPRHDESCPPTATTVDTAATLGARLQPWLSTLEKLAPPAYIEDMPLSPDDGVPSTMWIGCRELFRQPRSTADDLELLDRICEALSILTLLAHMDVDLLVREIMQLWRIDVKLREWIEYTLKPAVRDEPLFAVGLNVNELQFANVKRLARIHDHTIRANASPSAEYVELRTELVAAMSATGENDDLYSNVRVRIELDCFQQRPKDATLMLQEALDLVDAERQVSSPDESSPSPPALLPTPRFVIQEVSLTTTVAVVLGKHELALLKKLAAHGLRIGHIPPLCIIVRPPWVEKDPTKELVENVRYLTGLDEPEVPGVRLVSISDRFSPLEGAALLSALQQSPCVRTVELNLSGDSDDEDEDDEDEDEDEESNSRCEAWQWAAYTLFSRYATHKIERLAMDLRNLQHIEVDAVRQVLQAINPLALLLNPCGKEATDSANTPAVQLQASKFCVVDPTGRWNDDISLLRTNFTVTTRRPITVRVFEPPPKEKDPWWSVLLPGKGLAWLHRDDVLSTIELDPNDEINGQSELATTLPCIPRIDIARISDDSKHAAADLLELIGHGTKRIDLHEDVCDQPIEDWCARVLRACPQLEQLQLRMAEMQSLQFLIDAAEAGHSKLQELMVLYLVATESSQHVRHFLETLSDPNHALTRHLQDLDLWIVIENQDVSDIIGSALQMLEQNRQLHTIRLGFRLTTTACASRKPEFEQAFAALLEADNVPIRMAPLEMRSKLALLSVVFADPVVTASKPSAVHRLDSGVLSVVFQFAAQARTRKLTLSFSLPYTRAQT